jgi:hypothetical protein
MPSSGSAAGGWNWSIPAVARIMATSCRPRGASDKALALFSFPSLAAYEQYRGLFGTDPDFIDADRIRDESSCVLRYERTFMRPLLPGHQAG